MFESIMFKGKGLDKGDIITMVAGSFPFEFQAAVIDYDTQTDTLEVMSTQLVATRHSGLFPSSDVQNFEVLHKFDEAGIFAQYARANLHRGDICMVNGKWRAAAIAAFDGIVAGQTVDTPGVADGVSVAGGSSYWQVLAPAFA